MIACYVQNCLPLWVFRLVSLVLTSKCTAVLSNVPGPRKLLKLKGRTLHDLAFWGPSRYSTGCNFSLLTYGPNARFSVSADSALMTDAQYLVDEFYAEYQRLWQECSANIPDAVRAATEEISAS